MSDKVYHLETSLTADPRVSREEGIIRGVSVITGGIQASGHNLYVDKICVDQMCKFATSMPQVPLKINHGGGADTVAGFLTNFKVEGNQLRGDIHLLKSHEKFNHLMEMAERMPTGIGLSAAFRGEPEEIGGKRYARVKKLVSVDWVANPAANLNGLFEEKTVDTLSGDMDKPVELSEILSELKEFKEDIGKRLAGLESFRDEALTGFDDAEAEDAGSEGAVDEGDYTDEEIDDFVDELLADVSDSQYDDAEDVEEALDPAVAEFQALQEQVNQLEEERLLEQEFAEEAEFNEGVASLEGKLTELSEVIKTIKAENEALKLANRGAISPTKPTFLNSSRGEFNTEFESRLHELQHGDRKLTYSQAFEEISNKEPDVYATYLESKGINITLGA